jgi:hypothetical protein
MKNPLRNFLNFALVWAVTLGPLTEAYAGDKAKSKGHAPANLTHFFTTPTAINYDPKLLILPEPKLGDLITTVPITVNEDTTPDKSSFLYQSLNSFRSKGIGNQRLPVTFVAGQQVYAGEVNLSVSDRANIVYNFLAGVGNTYHYEISTYVSEGAIVSDEALATLKKYVPPVGNRLERINDQSYTTKTAKRVRDSGISNQALAYLEEFFPTVVKRVYDVKHLSEAQDLRDILNQQDNSKKMVRRFDVAISKLEQLTIFVQGYGQLIDEGSLPNNNETHSKFLNKADDMFKDTALAFSDVVSTPTKKDGADIVAGYQEYTDRVSRIFNAALVNKSSTAANEVITGVLNRRLEVVSQIKDSPLVKEAVDAFRANLLGRGLLATAGVLLLHNAVGTPFTIGTLGLMTALKLKSLNTRRDDGQKEYDLISAIMTGNQKEICKVELSQ